MKLIKNIFFVFLLVLVFFSAATLSFVFLSLREPKLGQRMAKESGQDSTEGVYERVSVLLLGHGGAAHEGGSLTDTLIVASIDSTAKKVNLVSIPRDLWVKIPVRGDIHENHKINMAFAIGADDKKYPLKESKFKGEAGGGTLAKEVVEKVIGMPVDYFVAVDFDNFKKIIDTLGGVEVNVPVGFDDYFYPVKGLENETCGFSTFEIAEFHSKFSGFELEKQFICRYEHLHFEKGSQTLDGETALKFVRSRHSATHGGDFSRSQRQHAVLLGMKDKLKTLSTLKKVDELFDQFIRLVKTDLDVTTVKGLAKIYVKPEDYQVNFISLTEDNVLFATKSSDGQFILIPKEGEGIWTGIQAFIQEQIK